LLTLFWFFILIINTLLRWPDIAYHAKMEKMSYTIKTIGVIISLVVSLLTITKEVIANGTQSASLQEETLKFSIAKDYFSDILSSQLAIFSAIVAGLLVLNWIYQKNVTKEEVKKKVDEQIEVVKKELSDDLNQRQKALVDSITERLNQGDIDISLLRGEVYRSMALFWDSQKSYGSAFIWWTRAAFYFSLIKDENLTRISLGAARMAVDKVSSSYELGTDIMGESQRLISSIDNHVYKVEIDLLYESLKVALSKTVSTGV